MKSKRICCYMVFCLCVIFSGCGSSVAKSEPATAPLATPTKQNQAIVYYSKNLTPESIKKVYARVNKGITGKVAIKFHRDDQYTETPQGVALMKALQEDIPQSALVETTYGGGPSEAKSMEERFKGQGLNFCNIDVLNADGGLSWPIKGGRLLKNAQVAKNLANYNSLVVYAPFRGQAYPGYGAALTNIGVGLQDGKGLVHGSPLNKDSEFFERMAEAGKAVTDHFAGHIAYVTALNNVVINCECNMQGTKPVTLGVLASDDIVAIDKAALDMVFGQKEHQGHDMSKKAGTLLGLYQLEFMTKLGMGSTNYKLVDVDA